MRRLREGIDPDLSVRATQMITPEQSRAARGLMNWSQTELAVKAGISLSTVRDIETSRRMPNSTNRAAILRAFEDSRVEFIEGGVRRNSAASKNNDGK